MARRLCFIDTHKTGEIFGLRREKDREAQFLCEYVSDTLRIRTPLSGPENG